MEKGQPLDEFIVYTHNLIQYVNSHIILYRTKLRALAFITVVAVMIVDVGFFCLVFWVVKNVHSSHVATEIK